MRVSGDDRVQGQRLYGPEIPVACFGCPTALEHPEIDQDASLRGLDEISRPVTSPAAPHNEIRIATLAV